MKLIYVVREAELQDIDEIQTIMRRRQKKFMSRLTISLILSNWYLTFKYFAIGAFACLNFESIAPIFPCVIVVPIFLLIEVIYSFIVTRFSMKASMKTIDKRVREGNTPQHQVWVVRRIGALVGLISLRDEAKSNLCLECDMFHCHEESEFARTFVLRHTLKTALSIAEDRKFAMVLFRCCDIFPDVVASFESLGFDLIMIHRVMILFSSILMLTFTKVLMLPDDLRKASFHFLWSEMRHISNEWNDFIQ
ncbi:uncharacterized protein LOC142338625 [Convolutriloba macropyga]|uniref:uncharacterized protein LOC142338625 n=1 Tax=Convolutriloba macropyga TaxID=536237 RepID=UPI003F51ADA1